MIYVLWLPLRGAFVRLLAAMAEGALALLERPPLITSLTTQGDIIEIHSYITGVQQSIASWNGENLHIFLVTSLALLLAVPMKTLSGRLTLAVNALALIVAVMLAICIVQLESAMDIYASTSLGMTLHSERVRALFDWANRGLIMVGMLLLPAFLFLRSYVSSWSESEAPRPGNGTPARARPGRPDPKPAWWRSVLPAAAGSIVAFLLLLVPRAEPSSELRLQGLNRLLALNPRSAQAHFNLGLHHEREGRPDKAIELYEEALRLDPGLVTARFGMGNILYGQGHYEEAARYYEEVMQRDPAHPSARYNLGNALLEMGQVERAAQSYEEALKIEPNHASAHKNLAVALIRLGRECEALGHFERSTLLDGRYANDGPIAAEVSRLRTVCGSSGNARRRTVAPQETTRAKPASRP